MRTVLRSVLVVGLAATALAQVPGRQPKQVSTRARERVDSWALQLGALHYPGGETAGADAISCCASTPAGGMVVAGNTAGAPAEANASGVDLFVARIGPFGDVAWISQVGDVTAPTIPALNGNPGGPGGDPASSESPQDLVIDQDGTILVTGVTTGSVGETHAGGSFSGDLFVARFAAGGGLLWFRQLGVETASTLAPASGATSWGDSSLHDGGARILLDPAGGFWVAGNTSSDLTEANTADGTIFLAHFTAGGVLDGLTELGEVTGAALGFPASGDLCGVTGMVPTSSGPLVSVTASFLSGSNYFEYAVLVAFDATGAAVSKTSTPSDMDSASGMVAAPGGSVFVCGSTYELVFDLQYEVDAVVARYEPSTDTWSWSTRLDATLAASLGLTDVSGADRTAGIALAPGGALVVAGQTSSAMDQSTGSPGYLDLYTMTLTASDGAVQRVHQIGQESAASGLDANGFDYARDVCSFPDGSIGVVGTTTGNLAETSGGSSDACALRLRPDGGL